MPTSVSLKFAVIYLCVEGPVGPLALIRSSYILVFTFIFVITLVFIFVFLFVFVFVKYFCVAGPVGRLAVIRRSDNWEWARLPQAVCSPGPHTWYLSTYFCSKNTKRLGILCPFCLLFWYPDRCPSVNRIMIDIKICCCCCEHVPLVWKQLTNKGFLGCRFKQIFVIVEKMMSLWVPIYQQ